MDDKIVYTNMPKLKHLPKTKKQSKYLGPYTVSIVTDSHVTISQTELGANKYKKIPIHITRPYFARNTKKRKVSLDSSIGFDTSQVWNSWSNQCHFTNILRFVCNLLSREY